MKEFAIRLSPGDDLRGSLEAFVLKQSIDAGYLLTAVGSLSSAMIRFADAPSPTEIGGPLEIVSLVGTLSTMGVHFHIVVADSSGKVCGGHLCLGSPVYTTAEIVIGVSSDMRFAREHDPRTGHRELIIVRNNNGIPL